MSDHRWMCRLCEMTGPGGRGGWQLHYIRNHYRLEDERRKPSHGVWYGERDGDR